MIITLVLRKHKFSAESWQKSLKKISITSTPGHPGAIAEFNVSIKSKNIPPTGREKKFSFHWIQLTA
jgi:hypothetical protein